jgi:hypothetical protein
MSNVTRAREQWAVLPIVTQMCGLNLEQSGFDCNRTPQSPQDTGQFAAQVRPRPLIEHHSPLSQPLRIAHGGPRCVAIDLSRQPFPHFWICLRQWQRKNGFAVWTEGLRKIPGWSEKQRHQRMCRWKLPGAAAQMGAYFMNSIVPKKCTAN